MIYLNSVITTILIIFVLITGPGNKPGGDQGNDREIERYLYASLHQSKTFHEPTTQGLFVYDMNYGHKLVKEFPAVSWISFNQHQNSGWSGVGAHAGTGRFFQVQDGQAIRGYDIATGRLLWEVYALNKQMLEKIEDPEKKRELLKKNFSYIDRRFGVTKDGKYLLVPDRDSGRKGSSLGIPMVKVLDASTGEWVRNIVLSDPENPKAVPVNTFPHNVHVMSRYIYVSMWNSGYIYCIDPGKLEVVRRLGPVEMEEMEEAPEKASGTRKEDIDQEAYGYVTLEPEHKLASIQHFSVDPREKYVFTEPVKAFGIGIIDVESGKFLGRWDLPEPEPGSLRARRYAIKEAEANQLHNKRNHGIAARPNSSEVWITEDRWGFAHIWDVSAIPPEYKGAVPVFTDIKQPIMDYSWITFSIDGKYAYASNRVIDADEHVIVAKLDGLNEACLEIQVKEGKIIRTGHDMGSGLDTWVRGYGPDTVYE